MCRCRRMEFLARLRRYLERVGQAPDGLPYVTIDVAAHKRFLLETIEREWGGDPDEAKRIREDWKLGSPFEAFVRWVAIGILDEIVPSASAKQLGHLIDAAIERLLNTKNPGKFFTATTGSPANDHIHREKAYHAYGLMRDSVPVEDWEFPPRYACEVRLIERRGDRVTLSRCGRTFLDTSGLAAVHWLATVEAAQALGVNDEFRLTPELAAHLATELNVTVIPSVYEHEPYEFAPATLNRLEAFGLVQRHELHDIHLPGLRYAVLPRHRPLFEEIAQRKSTPYAILADALLGDETTGLVERAHPNAARMMQESAAENYVRQARMVVHEIRNALLPAQVAFSSIAANLPADDQSEALQKRRARVEGGIQRALEFVDGMLLVANFGIEQPSTFDIEGALREACAGLSRELNGGFQQHIDMPEVSISGPRARFILAVTNLLRNAAQSIAGIPNGRVSITTEIDATDALVHVDDNGPGIPEANRSVIFEPGVTLRSGGSGQGLALVRQVVEGEMRGTVSCTNGPLDGARFTVRVPLQSRST